MRPRLYVDADHGFAQRAQGFEAGVAEFEAKVVFAFRVEGVMEFVAGGVRRALSLFSHVNFWMDFERVHKFPSTRMGSSGLAFFRFLLYLICNYRLRYVKERGHSALEFLFRLWAFLVLTLLHI
jgi:hypothetical protein